MNEVVNTLVLIIFILPVLILLVGLSALGYKEKPARKNKTKSCEE